MGGRSSLPSANTLSVQVSVITTYAIIEIMKGNPAYARFRYAKIIITLFNLVELHYKLLRHFSKQLADQILHKYSDYVIETETIKEANEFKLQHKQKRLSVPHAISYITAQKYGIKFITGDKQFKAMTGVEFVR